MKNLTNLHKKLDRITERLSALDTKVMTDARRSDAQLRLMNRSLQLLVQLHAETRAQTADVALLTAEALKASRESAERTAQILAQLRTQ